MRTTILLFAGVALGVVASPAIAQEMRPFTDDLGVTIEIPVEPLRIVSMHDVSLTIPLLELGIIPVGSHGRTTAEGVPFIRSSATLTGIDFDNSEIVFVGNYPADIEAVAALEPDLILTTTWQPIDPELLRQIAPTLVFNDSLRPGFGLYEVLADITGTTDRYEALVERYENQIAQLRRVIDTEDITVNVVQGVNGQVAVWHTYGSPGRVLRDAGFRFPEIVDAIPEGEYAEFSAEQLQALDADFIFSTYRTDALELPEDALRFMNEVLPNFCDFLHACRENQYIVIPREEASANSFYGLGQMAITVLTHISGQRYVPMPGLSANIGGRLRPSPSGRNNEPMPQKLFCSVASLDEGEPLPGLGNPYARLLLVRAPRREWRALRQCATSGEGRLGAAIKAAIKLRSRVIFVDGEAGAPALLSYPDALAVSGTGDDGTTEEMIVAWCHGASLSGEPEARTTILCCTDGRTDPCCARFGMATYRALADAADPAMFNLLQSSHLGGCRFATTLVTLPDNARYGRLTPGQVPAFLAALASGTPYLPALRGIGRLAEAAQVAAVGAMHWAVDHGLESAAVSIHESEPPVADAYSMEDTDPPNCEIRLFVGEVELVAFLRREHFPLLDDCATPDAKRDRTHPRWVLETLQPAE